MKAIQGKKLENQYNLRQKETIEAIQNIKKAALHEVQERRVNLKKLIEDMRNKQKRKTNHLFQKLQSVRLGMAKEMSKAYKKGNVKNCISIGTGEDEQKEKRKHFCTANFPDDFISFQNCNDTDDFCHLCCDTEFGEFYIGEREQCYKKSCNYKNIILPSLNKEISKE